MARKSKNESGTLLTTFGGALIAVASAKSLIDPVVLMPPITFTYMFISGVVITLLGIYKYLIIPRNLLTLTLFEPKNADFEKRYINI